MLVIVDVVNSKKQKIVVFFSCNVNATLLLFRQRPFFSMCPKLKGERFFFCAQLLKIIVILSRILYDSAGRLADDVVHRRSAPALAPCYFNVVPMLVAFSACLALLALAPML